MDEIERDDESFIFIIETEDAALKRLIVYPTIIENCQTCRGKGERAEIISATIKRLCHEFRTEAIWNEKERYPEVKLL